MNDKSNLKLKRIISLMLAILIFLCEFNVPVYNSIKVGAVTYSEGIYTYSVNSIGATLIGISEYNRNSNISIPDEFRDKPVIGIGEDAFYNHTELTSITIPSTVKTIEYDKFGTFAGCTNLKQLIFKSNYLKINSYDWLNGCDNLSYIRIPANLNLNGRPFAGLFYNCPNLNTIDLTGNSSSDDGYIAVDGVIYNYSKTVLEFWPAAINVDMEKIPESVTKINNCAFMSNKRISELVIPDSITSIEFRAFAGCDNLKKITIPYGVTSIEQAVFESVHEDFTIYCYKDSEAEKYAIENEYPYVIIGENKCGDDLFFKIDNNGNTLITGNGEMWDFNVAENPFNSQSDLIKSIEICDSAESVGNYAFKDFNINKVKFDYQPVVNSPNGDSKLTRIGKYSFYNTNIENVNIPQNVEFIGEGAFSNCSQLNSIIITNPDCIISDNSISNYGDKFDGTILGYINSTAHKYADSNNYRFEPLNDKCGDNLYYSLSKKGDLALYGSGDMWDYNILTHPSPFHNSSIKSVTMDDKVTKIGDYAFYGCDELETVQFSSVLESIGKEAFYGCTYIKVPSLPNSLTRIGADAFSKTKLLDDQTFKNTESVVKYVGKWAVDYNLPENIDDDNIQSVDGFFAENLSGLLFVRFKDDTIGIADNAFENNKYGRSYALPKSLKYIGNNSFSGNTHLKSITIPEKVISISNAAFSNLLSITFENSDCNLIGRVFDCNPDVFSIDNNKMNGNVKDYCDSNHFNYYYFGKYSRNFIPEINGNSYTNAGGVTDNKYNIFSGGPAAGFYNAKDYIISDRRKNIRDKINWAKNISLYNEWVGSCHGIALSMACEYNYTKNRYYDYERPSINTDLRDNINIYYLSMYQDFPNTYYSYTNLNSIYRVFSGLGVKGLYHNHTLEETLHKIVSETTLNYQKAYVLSYTVINKNTEERDQHSVLIQGCIKDQNGNYVIRLFEENGPYITTMNISSDYKNVSFNKIDLDNYDLEYLCLIDTDEIYKFNTEGEINDSNYKIVFDTTKIITMISNLNFSSYIPLARNILDGDFSSSKAILSSEPFDECKIQINSDSTDIIIFDPSGGLYQSTVGNNIENVTFNCESNTILLSGENMIYKTTINPDNKKTEENILISVSGEANGNIKLSAENGKVSVESDEELKKLLITTYIGDEEIEEIVDIESSKYQFIVKEDGHTESIEDSEVIIGDIDSDGMVTALDYMILIRYLLNIDSEIDLKTADLNNDNSINVMDSAALKKILLAK